MESYIVIGGRVHMLKRFNITQVENKFVVYQNLITTSKKEFVVDDLDELFYLIYSYFTDDLNQNSFVSHLEKLIKDSKKI